jgi:hypothetical protein
MTPNEEQMLETVSRFAQAYQSADIPSALTRFSKNARLVAADGRVYEGLDEIRSRLTEELHSASFKVVPRDIKVTECDESGTVQSQYDLIESTSGGTNVIHGEFLARLSHRSRTWFIDSAIFKRVQLHNITPDLTLSQSQRAGASCRSN